MKKDMKKILFAIPLFAMLLVACDPIVDEISPDPNEMCIRDRYCGVHSTRQPVAGSGGVRMLPALNLCGLLLSLIHI